MIFNCSKKTFSLDELVKIISDFDNYEKTQMDSYLKASEAAKKREGLTKEIEEYTQQITKYSRMIEEDKVYLEWYNLAYKLGVEAPRLVAPTDEENRRAEWEAEEMAAEGFRQGYSGMVNVKYPTRYYDKSDDTYLEELVRAWHEHSPKGESWESYKAKIVDVPKQCEEKIEECKWQISASKEDFPPSLLDLKELVEAVKSRDFQLERWQAKDFDAEGNLNSKMVDALKKCGITIPTPEIVKQQTAFKTLQAIKKICQNTETSDFTEVQKNFFERIERGTREWFGEDLPSGAMKFIMNNIQRFPIDDSMGSKFSKFINQIKEYCLTFLSSISKKGCSVAEAHTTSVEKMQGVQSKSKHFRSKLEEAAPRPNEAQDSSFKP